jgi:hypothetical protein
MPLQNLGYKRNRRIQFVVKYYQYGTWFTKYFHDDKNPYNARKRAMAFRQIILNSPDVETVSVVGTIYG